MKLTVEMPLTTMMRHGRLRSVLARVQASRWRPHRGRPKQDHFERFIQIFCEDRQAQILPNLARQVCPEVVGTIKTTRGLPRGAAG